LNDFNHRNRVLDSAQGVPVGNDIFRFKIGHFNGIVIRSRDEGDFNVLLIRTGQRHVLIEAGIGQDLIPGSPYPGLLSNRLREAGISPADIDPVIFSHADFDHIGGGVDESGKAAFLNARYILSREEWGFWSSNPERLRPSQEYSEDFRQICRHIPLTHLEQLHDKLEIVASGTEVVSGVRLIAAPGHTPGHTAIAVTSGDEQLLFIGDLIYTPDDLENPDWFSIYDYDPAQAIATRQQIFAQAAQDHTLLMTYHLPFPGLGHVVQHGRGWQWRPLEMN
jgi:glyoxylase-like metal-dependent hydrolase (beta-lactamase superfamily II)